MRRATFEMQADRIEAVLASHKIQAQVSGGQVNPRYVRFNLMTGVGVRLKRIVNLSEEIALALGVAKCRIRRNNGNLQVEVPLRHSAIVQFSNVMKRGQRIPACSALLGVDEQGHPLFVRLPSPEVAHILVAGTTGCGKTMLLRSMILSLALTNRRSSLQIVLVDPKMRGFAALARLPHLLWPIVHSAQETTSMLERLVAEMLRRDEESRSEPRVVVVIDELADLAQEGGQRCVAMLTRLAQRGREAGIHLIAGTQKPTSQVVGSLFKSNFPVRLVGRVTSAEDALIAAGIGGTAAEKLLGRGDFLAVASGDLIHFQGPFVSDQELQHLARQLEEGNQWPLESDSSRRVHPKRRPMHGARKMLRDLVAGTAA